jgi:AraC-like DNA-binding protein
MPPIDLDATEFRPNPVGKRTMLSSAVRSFQDPWEHQAFVRASTQKVLVTIPGQYRSALTRIDLHRLWLQRNDTSLPQITYVEHTAGRCPIGFVGNPQHQPLYSNGTELLPDMMIIPCMMGDHHFRMAGESQIASLSLAPADLATASRALIGRELSAPAVTRHIHVPGCLMARLRSLHEAACHLAANAPDILAHPEVAKALEEKLVYTMVKCLAETATVETRTRLHTRMPVMKRFERAIEEAENQPLYMTELCHKIGVQERTLRNHCLEYLDMSPHRYLWLRRMALVRRALDLAKSTEKTVTVIANDYGFWELGRFSVAYRKLFGESPSTTLRNAAGNAQAAAHLGAARRRLPILP